MSSLLRPLLAVLLALAGVQGSAWAQITGKGVGDKKKGTVEGVKPLNPTTGATEGKPAAGREGEVDTPPLRARTTPSGTVPDPWVRWWDRNHPRYLIATTRSDDRTPAHLLDPQRRHSSLERQRPEVLEVLDRALKDSDASVRCVAVLSRALASAAGDVEWAEHLRELRQDSSAQVRDVSLLAAALSEASPAVHDLWSLILGGTRHSAARSESDRHREQAVVAACLALADRGPPTSPLSQALRRPALSESLRALWIHAAGFAEDDRHLATLHALIEDRRESAVVRCAAVDALARGQDRSALELLARSLQDPGSPPDLRISVVQALGRIADPSDGELVHCLERAAHRDGHAWVRCFALLALGEVGGSSAESTLAHFFGEGRALERPFAALALGLLGRAGSGSAVLHLLQHAPRIRSQSLREATLLALGLCRDERAFETLQQALTEKNPALRRAACRAMGVHGHPGCLRLLEDVMDTDAVPDVRAAAAETYGSLDPLATVPLQRRLVDGHNDSLQDRVALLRALGCSRDPQAAPVLIDAGRRTGASSAERRAALQSLGALYRPEIWPATAPLGFGANFFREPAELGALLELSR